MSEDYFENEKDNVFDRALEVDELEAEINLIPPQDLRKMLEEVKEQQRRKLQ